MPLCIQLSKIKFEKFNHIFDSDEVQLAPKGNEKTLKMKQIDFVKLNPFQKIQLQ
jgi:hypothetical protein